MPLYEYRCGNCGHAWEELSQRAGKAAATCPRCGGSDVRRLPPVPNVLRGPSRKPGMTCCGREERCDAPPCSLGDSCRRG